MKKRKKIQVKVPAGIDDGQQLRVSGQGEPGVNGGPAGDLYVVFHVRDHEFFERDGDDIYCEMPITFAQAALGDEIEVPTLHGKVKLKIPAGTQTGTRFRLKGKGIAKCTRLWARGSTCGCFSCDSEKINRKTKAASYVSSAEISGKCQMSKTMVFFQK